MLGTIADRNHTVVRELSGLTPLGYLPVRPTHRRPDRVAGREGGGFGGFGGRARAPAGIR